MASEMVSSNAETDITVQGPVHIGELTMYQTVTCSQVLMPDNSNCLAVQAFLRMCGISYRFIETKNAEEMSPTGQIPFVKCEENISCQFEEITEFISKKGVTLEEGLGRAEMVNMLAYMSLINMVLFPAETYLVWFEFWGYCRWRVGHMWPWPLNWYVCHVKKNTVVKQQRSSGWYRKSADQVYKEVDSCLSALSDRLGDDKYFYGDCPSQLDALVYGHVFSMLTTPLPTKVNKLAETVRVYPNLIKHCQTVDREFFKGHNRNKIH